MQLMTSTRRICGSALSLTASDSCNQFRPNWKTRSENISGQKGALTLKVLIQALLSHGPQYLANFLHRVAAASQRVSNVDVGCCITGHTFARSCGRLLQFDVAEQRQADLKLLEAPDIGTGVGGKPKVLVPKAVDADEEGDDDDDEESESSDDEVIYALQTHSAGHPVLHVDC